MLIEPDVEGVETLSRFFGSLPQLAHSTDFGADINEAHEVILSDRPKQEKMDAFLQWAMRYQPCMFGRLGARGVKGIGYDILWLDEYDLSQGELYLEAKIQQARNAWKARALEGDTHGFLVIFNSTEFTYCRPGDELIELCRKISDLYLPEARPVSTDTIYTEAVPLRGDDGIVRLFKGGINVFYTSAHGTANHDRRIPGGLMISTNSPGHLGNSLLKRGYAQDLEEAAQIIYDLVIRSIGAGGIGKEDMPSCTWHRRLREGSRAQGTNATPEPGKRLPRYVPEDFDPSLYEGVYHTDILVPDEVTRAERSVRGAEVWKYLYMDYVTLKKFDFLHPDYGFWYGYPVPDEAMFYNPWLPEKALNEKWDAWPHWSRMIETGHI